MTELRALPFEHRIHLFYDFSFSARNVAARLAKLDVGTVAPPGWIHPTRTAGNPKRPIADKAVWEWSDWDVSLDLHPFVHEILDSSHENPTRPRCLRLSAYGKNLLAGRYRAPLQTEEGSTGETRAEGRPREMPAEGLRLRLNAFSRALLSEGDVPVAIDDVSLHLFGTGFGVAVVTVRIESAVAATLAHSVLVEAVPRLCDERGERFVYWADSIPSSAITASTADAAIATGTAGAGGAAGVARVADAALEGFSLGSTVAALVERAACTLTKRERTYSFVALVFDDKLPPPEKRDLAFRLSRHYNARYRPAPELTGTFFAQPFETVLHAMSREGVCTVVDFVGDEAHPVEFIATWLRQAHARVYVPLQVAAYHEHVVLLDLAQGAGRPIDAVRTGASDIALMRKLGASFLLFRLRYRLSQVSGLTTHDLAYAATEQALGLAALSEKIGRDLLAVERRLIDVSTEKAEAAAKRVERRWALPVSIGSGAVTYLSLNGTEARINDAIAHAHGGAAPAAQEILTQVLIVALALAAFAYTWNRQRAGTSDSDRIAEHEAAEAAIAAAEKDEG